MTDREMRDILRDIDHECGIVDPEVVTPPEEEVTRLRLVKDREDAYRTAYIWSYM